MSRRPWKDPFDVDRCLKFNRARTQARFRGEQWTMTFEDWNEFWPTPEIWSQRGRSGDRLCLTRRDPTGPWSRENCCRILRSDQVRIGICQGRTRTSTAGLWSTAVFLDPHHE